jgi:glyoxylase-like metal-dependent hydrolase (beta-lactamase superfamily II)
VTSFQAFSCGTVTTRSNRGPDGFITVPVPVYLIEHPQGRVLVDTGLHPEAQQRIGRLGKVMRCDLPAGHDVASRLASLDLDPADLRCLVNTHLHFDHAGGNGLIPDAVEVVVQRAEWAAAHDPDGIERNMFVPADYDHGQPVLEVTGEHDLFGDGEIVLLPTPGHTPGHQSILLSGATLLVGDACYFADWLDSEESPPYGDDKAEELRSLRMVRSMRDRGIRLVFGHDPPEWLALPERIG